MWIRKTSCWFRRSQSGESTCSCPTIRRSTGDLGATDSAIRFGAFSTQSTTKNGKCRLNLRYKNSPSISVCFELFSPTRYIYNRVFVEIGWKAKAKQCKRRLWPKKKRDQLWVFGPPRAEAENDRFGCRLVQLQTCHTLLSRWIRAIRDGHSPRHRPKT